VTPTIITIYTLSIYDIDDVISITATKYANISVCWIIITIQSTYNVPWVWIVSSILNVSCMWIVSSIMYITCMLIVVCMMIIILIISMLIVVISIV
jgi:uncharacterized membrane protein